MVKVCQYDLKGVYLGTFDTKETAPDSVSLSGFDNQLVYSCAAAKGFKSVTGYLWRYKRDFPNKENLKIPKKHRKDIHQYNLLGKYLKTFESIGISAKVNDLSAKDIDNCCRNRSTNSCTGYIWRYSHDFEPGQDIDLSIVYKSRKTPINQYSAHGKYIRTFTSIRDAELLTRVTQSRIRSSCNLLLNTTNPQGFIWRFRSEFPGKKDLSSFPQTTLH